MKFFSKLIDNVRTMTGVRKVRQLSGSKEKPAAGTSIVLDNLRLRIRYPIEDELWQWLYAMGWRAMPLANNRRRYRVISERVVLKMFKADLPERNAIHERILQLQVPESRVGDLR